MLLPALIGLPILAGLALRLVSGAKARGLAIAAAGVHLALTLAIVAGGMTDVQSDPSLNAGIDRTKKKSERIFAPQFVPGDPLKDGLSTYSTTYDIVVFHGTTPKGERVKLGAAQFFIGIDGINIWLVALASFMLVPVILYSWDSIKDREGAYYSWLFFLQAGVLGVFLSFDILLFYICFELTLIPLLFLIGGWGAGPNRRDASRKLFLFTLAGGLITLIGLAGLVLFVYSQTQELTFSIPRLADLIHEKFGRYASESTRQTWLKAQTYLFIALAAGFLVKVPVVPLHTWQPGAYTEAPTGVTVMLSSLLAKMGTFGLVRICLPLCPDATLTVGMPLVGTLAVIGIIYGGFCAYAQTDLRKLLAYSSLSHLGLVVLAIMAFSAGGIGGGLLHMVNHGLSTGAMFLLAGMLIRRYGTAQIADYSGVWTKLPVLAGMLMVSSLASVGLPGLNNFISEMLMFAGILDARNTNSSSIAFVILAALGIFLSAWYTITMVRRVLFGPEKLPATPAPIVDLTTRERFAVAPVVILCGILGVLAQPAIDVMQRDVVRLTLVGDEARLQANK